MNVLNGGTGRLVPGQPPQGMYFELEYAYSSYPASFFIYIHHPMYRAPVTTTIPAATTSLAAVATPFASNTTTYPSASTNLSFPNVPSSSGATSRPPTDSDRTDCLAAHNAVRQSVPVANKPADLTYNQDLEQAACAWSRYLANTGKFEHSSGKVGKFGENL